MSASGMKVFFTFFLAISFSMNLKAQQGVLFTQYVFNGLLLNPAYAGYQDHLNFNAVYRSQWTGFPGAPKTFSFSADAPLLNERAGVGILLVNDQLGAQENTSAEADFSYRIQLNQNSSVNFGVGLSINQYAVNPDLISLLQPESVTSKILLNSTSPELRAGVFYYSAVNYLGFSVNNMLPQHSDPGAITIQTLRNYSLTAGTLIDLNSGIKLKPSFLIREDFRNPANLDLNAFFIFNDFFWAGISYRTDLRLGQPSNQLSGLSSANALSISAEVFTTRHWRFGYAFDYSLNALSNANQGSHEISIGYKFNDANRKDPTRKCYYF